MKLPFRVLIQSGNSSYTVPEGFYAIVSGSAYVQKDNNLNYSLNDNATAALLIGGAVAAYAGKRCVNTLALEDTETAQTTVANEILVTQGLVIQGVTTVVGTTYVPFVNIIIKIYVV